MNVLETEWWSLALPPEWWAETEEESIVIGDRDGVGCIEISTLHRDSGEFESAEIGEIAAAEGYAGGDWRSAQFGDFRGVGTDFLEDETAVLEWFVASGPRLLYITYSCDAEHRGMDDAAVREILDTLVLAS